MVTKNLDIPQNWNFVKIGDHFTFRNGLNKEKSFFGKGTPIINILDVFNNSGLTSEQIAGKVTLSNDELRAFGIKKGDVLFARTSETIEEIGISSVVLEELKNTVFSGFLLRARPKTQNFDLNFKKYCFRSSVARKQIVSLSSKTTRALTNGRLLSKVIIPIPKDLSEQHSISVVISDTEELVNQFQTLIEKKKNIKQGVMQELLTGKRRLEGVDGEWETKQLGKIICIQKGEQLNKSNLTLTDIFPVWNGGMDPSGFTNKYNQEGNTITISEGGNSCGFVNFSFKKFWAGGHCYTLNKSKIDLNKIFLYYLLKNSEKSIMKLRVGSGLPNIQKKRLLQFEISLPPAKEEQNMIAKILSDMDSEIEQLEKKLSKYKMIKEGMMQKLLTGEIRLN